jgi:hypothetical protein
MPERRAAGVSFRVEGLRVETRGLSAHDHPELALEVDDASDLGAARALLVSLAAEVVVRGRRYGAGAEIEYGGEALCFGEATIEVWEQDPSTTGYRRGAPRLLAKLRDRP